MLRELKKASLFLMGFPKTLYFNFKYFDFAVAIKLPVIISSKVYLLETNGKILINSDNISIGMIKIGFGSVGIFDIRKSRSIWEVSGNVIFNGFCNIGHGSKICVTPNGTLAFGNNFNITAESSIICNKKISFGNDCLISWDNLFMDTDLHEIIDEKGAIINIDEDILIGNKCWIGCRCTILKGTSIMDNTVIAANSVVAKKITRGNQIIAGCPARSIREDIHWK